MTRDELIRVIAFARAQVHEAAIAAPVALALERGLDAMRGIVASGRTPTTGELRDNDVGPLAVRNLDADVPMERSLCAAIAEASFGFGLLGPSGDAQAIQAAEAHLRRVRAQRRQDDLGAP